MVRPRAAHPERHRQNITITVPKDVLVAIDEEAAREGSRLSAYFMRAMEIYLSAPQIGGRRVLPTREFAVLQVRPDEICFIPRSWKPEDLRRAADLLETQGKE